MYVMTDAATADAAHKLAATRALVKSTLQNISEKNM